MEEKVIIILKKNNLYCKIHKNSGQQSAISNQLSAVGDCLKRDNPLNPPYQGDRIYRICGLVERAMNRTTTNRETSDALSRNQRSD